MVDGNSDSSGDLALAGTFFVVVLVGTFASQVRHSWVAFVCQPVPVVGTQYEKWRLRLRPHVLELWGLYPQRVRCGAWLAGELSIGPCMPLAHLHVCDH